MRAQFGLYPKRAGVRNQSLIIITSPVSEPNYYTPKCFSEDLLAIETKKIKVKMNMPVYFGMSILEISKTLMYEYWYNYDKLKYQNNAKL